MVPAAEGQPSFDELVRALLFLFAHGGSGVTQDAGHLRSSLSDLLPGYPQTADLVARLVQRDALAAIHQLPRAREGQVGWHDLESLAGYFEPADRQQAALALAALAQATNLRVTQDAAAAPVSPPSITPGDVGRPAPPRTENRLPLEGGNGAGPVSHTRTRRPKALIPLVVAAIVVVLGLLTGLTVTAVRLVTGTPTVPVPPASVSATPRSETPRATPTPVPAPPPASPQRPTSPSPKAPAPSSAPSPAPRNPQPGSRGGMSTAEVARLRALVPAAFACTYRWSENVELNRKLLARIECVPDSGPGKVRYYRYSDAQAMRAAYRLWHKETRTSDCRSTSGISPYFLKGADQKKPPKGTLACLRRKGNLAFVWTDTKLGIVSIAEDKDISRSAMYRWWSTKAGPYG